MCKNYLDTRSFLANIFSKYDVILLLPDDHEPWNRLLITMFEQKMQIDKQKGYVLSVCGVSNRKAGVVPYEQMVDILRLYTLYDFSNKFFIGSLSKPYGRLWLNLVKAGRMSTEELAAAIIGVR